MIAQASQSERRPEDHPPTVWGLTAMQVGLVLWASYGVDCIALGSSADPQAGADLYLLEYPGERVAFDLASLHGRLLWNGAKVTVVEVTDELAPEFEEHVEVEAGLVTGVRRAYGRARHSIAVVRLTTSREIAAAWSESNSVDEFERHPAVIGGETDWVSSEGVLLKATETDARVQRAFITRVVRTVPRPDRILRGVERAGPSGVFCMSGQPLASADFCLGAVWIGDREAGANATPLVCVGPDFIADASSRHPVEIRPIAEIFSPDSSSRADRIGSAHSGYAALKRAFDVVFSMVVLVVMSPVLLLTCVLIAIEDGFPVQYFQWRESLGGREYRCWKLRSMRRGAESMVAQLQALNQSDGPQVFIKDDPRVTRVGRIIRKLQIDEFPQFINVLLGDMSVVGPRPSPRKENQFCPAWRETRLSVRPGITGLWQVMRTRAPGKDFQEWIRYDTQYVERMGFWLDMWIIWRTVMNLVTGGRKPGKEP